MARDKEEELLNLPEFDEKDFIRTERNRARAVVTFFLIGAGFGLLAGYLYDLKLWYFSVILVFVFLLFMRFIMQALRLELPKTTGQRFFLVMEFILTFIIFWILFLNPPFSVVSGPQVSNIQVQGANGQWTGVTELSTNVYAWTPGNSSYRAYVYFVYPITTIQVNEKLYNGPPQTSGANLAREATNITHNYAGDHLYFNITSNFRPSAGYYLVIEVVTLAHGESQTFSFTLVLAGYSAGSPVLYPAGIYSPIRAGVV